MHRVERFVEVERPISVVYDQWTRFEEFPRFMFGVKAVHRIDPTHLRWTASVWGVTEEWVAEIVEQQPNSRISWKSVSGKPSAGTVRFEPLSATRTRVRLGMAYQPQGLIERVGEALGFLDAQVQNAVDDFKVFIETRDTGRHRQIVDG